MRAASETADRMAVDGFCICAGAAGAAGAVMETIQEVTNEKQGKKNLQQQLFAFGCKAH